MRTRVLEFGEAVGQWRHDLLGPDWTQVRIFPVQRSVCKDETGKGYPHPLRITHVRYAPVIRNGKNGHYEYQACPYYGNDLTPYYLQLPPPLVDDTGFAAQAAARTNPGKPAVQVQVFLFELRDLPRLIHVAGRSLLSNAGNAYLGWQFGWRPLVNDLVAIAEFSLAVEKRKKQIRDMDLKGGLHSRYKDRSDLSHDTMDTYSVHYVDAPLRCNTFATVSRKRWATLRWRSNMPPGISRDESSMAKLAMKSVLGLTPGQISSNLWEAIPWSWLGDYFTNIGDYLSASDNSIGVMSDDFVFVMTHTKETVVSGSAYDPGGYTVPGYTVYVEGPAIYEVKERKVELVLPFSASIPFLNGGQLGILSALSASRWDAYKRYRT